MSDKEEAEAIYQEAVTLQGAGRNAEAVVLLRRLTEIRLTRNVAFQLGVCLSDLGQYDEAETWVLLAARHGAGRPEVRLRLGAVYAAQGRIDLAELEYRTALALAPDHGPTQLALAALLLSVGRYAEGWPLLEARAALHPDLVPPVAVSYPEWRGEPLNGKAVLVWVEQGFGDQIQMSRFVTLLKARGARAVTLACRPPLAALFETLPGVDTVMSVAAKSAVSVPYHDVWTRYFSLPGRLGATLQNLPSAPYLSAPAGRRARWAGARGIGLTWQASPTGFNGANKSLPPPVAQRLLDLGAMSLHPEDTGAADFADTAAIIEQLDLVISIDTSVAHLAGAMGKPVWTLLPRINLDWRWGRAGAASPWYPTMRLYRQANVGEWDMMVDRVVEDIEAAG